MTWEELKARAKEIGAHIYISEFNDGFERIDFRNASFFQDGCVSFSSPNDFYSGVIIIAKHRTEDQMWRLMEALR